MGSLTDLRAQAITAAKLGNWQEAVAANQEIIVIHPTDIAALNRLGMALLQQGEATQATETFQNVLAIDATNPIAKKQLERIATNQTIIAPQFCKTQFIEEPGKSKVCLLHRLAGKNVLEVLKSGQSCQLKPKTRFISVETDDGMYIGSLPDDVSYRLSQLIESGNTYDCVVYTVTKTECSVFVKEKYRSQPNQNTNSFPLGNNHVNQSEDGEDAFLLLDENGMESDKDDDATQSRDGEDQEEEFEQERFTSEDIDRMQ